MLGLKFKDPQGNTVAEVQSVDRQINVGRASDVDIALPYKAVSRYHARFFSHGGVLYVEDLGSSNGVQVNGSRISEPTRLDAGDYARIGIINVVVVAPVGSSPPVSPSGYAQAGMAGAVAGVAGVPQAAAASPAVPAAPAAPSPFSPAAAPPDAGYPTASPPAAFGQPPQTIPSSPPAHAAVAPPPAAQGGPPPGYPQPTSPAPTPGPQAPAAAPMPARQAPAPIAPAPVNPFEGAVAEPPTLGRPEGEAPPALEEPSTLQDAQAPDPAHAPADDPEQPTMALPAAPRLIGETPPLAGEVVYLDSPELTVGRIKGSGLMIEDASVSRSHAKILKKGDSELVLFDLRSFNGTWVNDERITKATLNDGDTVRFGDVSFRFALSNEAPEAKPRRTADAKKRRLRLTLLGVGVVLVLLVIAGNLLKRSEPPPPPPDPQAEARARQAKIQRRLERGQAELRRRDWEAASATLQGVLKLDPLNERAVEGLELARLERERQGWLEEAERIAATGRDLDRAQALLQKVPQKSTYYADSRVRLRQVNRVIAENAKTAGLSNCRAWRYEECQRLLCQFFQTWPVGEPIPDEVRVRRALERAEQKLSRRRRGEFEPCKIPEPGTGNEEADTALLQRYPDEKIRRAVVSYYQGHAEDALRMLAALEKNRDMEEQRPTINRLLQHMLRVETASADCHRDVRAERLDEAARSFEVMEEADREILPSKLRSHYVREAGTRIAEAYLRIGETHYRSNRLRESFNAWSKGKRFSPEHPDTLRKLLLLDGRAREACEAARARMSSGDVSGAISHFELCRDITAETDPLHQQALAGLSKLGR